MGLESLFAFTMVGGLAAGAYTFEVAFCRVRNDARPWLFPLITVVLFALGLIAAATHVHSFSHAFDSLFGGTVNYGSGMVHEVIAAGLFFVLVLADTIIAALKKDTPYVLRVVAAIVAVVCIVLMGMAYIDILGNAVWCNVPATVLSFVGGAAAMGIAVYALFESEGYRVNRVRMASIVSNAVLVVGIALEISAFVENGLDPVAQIIGLIVAPVASIAAVLCAKKVKNARMLAAVVCVLTIVGVAVSRWAFYATNAMM